MKTLKQLFLLPFKILETLERIDRRLEQIERCIQTDDNSHKAPKYQPYIRSDAYDTKPY